MRVPNRPSSTRAAFTLIEAVVVVGIIGLLIAITMPAVQSSREAGRRVHCANQLKQIGVALAAHHNIHRRFPAGMLTMVQTHAEPMSVLAQLLPLLEESNLYNELNTEIYHRDPNVKFHVFSLTLNTTAMSRRVGLFVCPSDGVASGSTPSSNYRACVGPNPAMHDGTPWPGGGGAFAGLIPLSAADVKDGLSRTAGLSERLIGRGLGHAFDRSRDLWYSEYSKLNLLIKSDEMAAVCASLNSTPSIYASRMGAYWFYGSYGNTLYNHVYPPNFRGTDCSAAGESDRYLIGISSSAISARSAHPQGVHVLLMDGSLRFVRDSISVPVWRALASRSGGEVVSLDD